MSPELLDPDLTGPEGTRLTKQSDCYALGMVIYEVLSGQAPFTQFRPSMVILKVIRGERPERPSGPEGTQFTNNLWQTLNWCWELQPQLRPSAKAILESLEQVSEALGLPSRQGEEEVGTDEDSLDGASDSSEVVSWFNPRYFAALLCVILCLSQLQAITKNIFAQDCL